MTPYGRSPRPLHMARPESDGARPTRAFSVKASLSRRRRRAARVEVRSKEEGNGAGGRRASQRRSWLDGGAYDVDLTEAIEELGPQFKELLSVILLHLVQMSPRSG